MITKEQLKQIMPDLHEDQAITFAPVFDRIVQKYDLSTLLRKSAFIANVAHETGELQYLKELWGTPHQLLYERDASKPWHLNLIVSDRNYLAYSLGNSEPGDGKLFRGRGGFQYTGRKNYSCLSKKMGIDFIVAPGLLEQPDNAIESAAIYWSDNKLSAYADNDNLDAIADIINIGHKTIKLGDSMGWNQRLIYYNKAKQILI